MRDYAEASQWRQQAALLLAEHGLQSVSPVFGPWEGDAPPALTPAAVEWPDLEELETCRYILVSGGAGSGTGFGLGYAFARKLRGDAAPESLVWVNDGGDPPPFIRLWNPVQCNTLADAVRWIVDQEERRAQESEGSRAQ